MEFKPPTYDDIIELLDMAVAERGADYVYKHPDFDIGKCLYVHPNSEVGCIMAYVFNKLGVSLSILKKLEGIGAPGVYSLLYLDGKPEAHGKISLLLSKVQGEQDNGIPWGKAVQKGKNRVAEFFD